MRDETYKNRRRFLQSTGIGLLSAGGLSGIVGSVGAQESVNSGENDWAFVGYDSGNSRYNPNISGPERDAGVSRVMTFEAEETFRTGSPVIANNQVFIAPGNEARLYAIDIEDWSIDWIFETDREIEAQPTVSNGTVYIESGSGIMHAVNADTGEERWQQEEVTHGSNNVSPPVVVDDVLYNIDSSPREGTYALDVADGSILWTADYRSRVAGPAVADGVVYTVSEIDDPMGMAALSATDGEELWFVEIDAGPTASPVVADGLVFYAERSSEANLYAFNAENGDEIWQFGPADSRITAPAVADGIAVVHAGLDGLYAIDIQDGSELWQVDTHSGWWSTGVSLPAVADGVVYVKLDNEELSALNIETGEELWTVSTAHGGSSAVSSPAVSDGSVYVQQPHQSVTSTDEDSVVIESVVTYPTRLYAIETGGQQPPEVTIEGPDSVSTGELVTFSAVIGPDGDWDIIWGVEDGENAVRYSGQEISHEFENEGEFSIGVGVEDDNGIGNTAWARVDVEGSAGTTADATVFQQFDDATDSPLFPALVGGGALGASYIGYRKLKTDSDRVSEDMDTNSNTDDEDLSNSGPNHSSSVTVSTYDEIQIGETVEQTGRVKILCGTVGSDEIWVVKPNIDNYETVSTEALEQFKTTVEPWSKMDPHPQMLNVCGFGSSPTPWLAVESTDYPPVTKHVNTFSHTQIVKIIQQVCDALHHIQRYGTSYENLTMMSVLYTDEDEVKLRGVLDQFEELDPWYNAPEEFDVESTEQSTIYRIGLIAYELFTGTLPYAEYPDGVAREAVQSDELIPPSEQVDGIPPALESTIMKALSKSPDDRQETVLHLRDEFDSLDLN